MTHLFLGSHSAIDFVNTAFAPEGREIETIGDGATFIDWMVGAGLLQEPLATKLRRKFGAKALDAAAAEAREMRAWARDWIARWRHDPGADYSKEIDTLNRLLLRVASHREVVSSADGLRIVERDRLEEADALLALIARGIAALITGEQPSLVKACAGSTCTLWFLDRTKGHRRLFCSPTACGNRAKVAAFRKRQRN